jgi:anti-sigma B factor antagonist
MAKSAFDDDLTVTLVIEDDVVSVSVMGDLDVFSVRQLSASITSEIDAGRARIVVDLSGVTFVDGYSVGILVGLTIAALAADVQLVFTHPSQQFLRVKQLVDSGRVLNVPPS